MVPYAQNADSVELFLLGLKRPCAHLAPKLREFGIRTGQDLDALCMMPHCWGEVEQYFRGEGMTPFEWLIVQEGFKSRALTLLTAEAQ